jgi:glyoxylase-like metal-dependent hydrolase (beta-lactamase superfamily II)/rhodanese-related sulfurtransferase
MEEKLMTVETLQEKLNKHENVFILDVRPTDQRDEWHIAESTHIDAYKRLNAGDNTVLDEVDIPENSTVVTVCAAGRTSIIASKALQERGVNAYSLKGGMKAWNYAWNMAELNLDNVKIIQVRRAAKGVLSYMIGSLNEAVVIDAALDPEVYTTLAKENGWTIKYVMDTHIHADYVSRTRELANVTAAKHLMIDKAKVDFGYMPVAPGESVAFGEEGIQFLHTPGHTWESATFKIEKALFTGDTLFVDGIGRPDLKAGQAEAVEKARSLYRSLNKLFAQNAEMVVLPAHTSNTINFDGKLIGDTLFNIGARINISDLSEHDFVEYALSRIPPTPPNYLAIAGINRKGSYESQILADLEAGGNHCAIK